MYVFSFTFFPLYGIIIDRTHNNFKVNFPIYESRYFGPLSNTSRSEAKVTSYMLKKKNALIVYTPFQHLYHRGYNSCFIKINNNVTKQREIVNITFNKKFGLF